MYDLESGPLVLKYDFKNKYPVKGIAVTSDQRTAIFNVQRSLVTIDVLDILMAKGKDKILDKLK